MDIRTVAHMTRDVNERSFQRHGFSLTRGERMLKIHVWKSKPSWFARPMQERQALIHRLMELVSANLGNGTREEAGPYLVYQAKDILLIWTIEADSVQLPAEYESIRLAQDFEPLTFVSASKTMTAKKLAEKLSR